MVNCITLNSTSRVVMTSCRNAFTMVTSCTVLWSIILMCFWSKLYIIHVLWFPENHFLLKVANLSLYAVAFVVFKFSPRGSVVAVEHQVYKRISLYSCLTIIFLSKFFLTLSVCCNFSVPLDSLCVDLHWLLFCRCIPSWNCRAEVGNICWSSLMILQLLV